jgi:hypothetical protein
MVVLRHFRQVSMVNAICPGILPEMDEALERTEALERDGVRFKIIPPDAHPLWFGYSFNPGLRRLACYRGIGSFAAVGHESDLSLYFKSLGMGIANLERPAFTHIGEGRHVEDSVFPITRSPAFRSYRKTKAARQPSSAGKPGAAERAC